MLGFGSWHWINDHMLIGESGIQKLGDDGLPVKSDDNVGQTKLYVYDISTKALAEVSLPTEIKAQVFTITKVGSNGHVCLHDDEPGGDSQQELGWFQVGQP